MLDKLLRETDQDVAISQIHDYLELVGNRIRANEYKLQQFIIHKALTKAPEQYPKKGDGQPHVIVALRMNKKNPGKFKGIDLYSKTILHITKDKLHALMYVMIM